MHPPGGAGGGDKAAVPMLTVHLRPQSLTLTYPACPSEATYCACVETIYRACPSIAKADAAAYSASTVVVNCPGECPSAPDLSTTAGQKTCGFKPQSFVASPPPRKSGGPVRGPSAAAVPTTITS